RRTWIGLTARQYEVAFNAKTAVLARTLVIVIAPVFSLVVAMLSLDRGKPAVQHFVFGLHYLGFMLVLTMVVGLVMRLAGLAWFRMGLPISDWGLDQVTGVVFAVVVFVYLYFAFQRAYGDRRGWAVLKSGLAVFAIVVTLTLYRMLLFYATVFALSAADSGVV